MHQILATAFDSQKCQHTGQLLLRTRNLCITGTNLNTNMGRTSISLNVVRTCAGLPHMLGPKNGMCKPHKPLKETAVATAKTRSYVQAARKLKERAGPHSCPPSHAQWVVAGSSLLWCLQKPHRCWKLSTHSAPQEYGFVLVGHVMVHHRAVPVPLKLRL